MFPGFRSKCNFSLRLTVARPQFPKLGPVRSTSIDLSQICVCIGEAGHKNNDICPPGLIDIYSNITVVPAFAIPPLFARKPGMRLHHHRPALSPHATLRFLPAASVRSHVSSRRVNAASTFRAAAAFFVLGTTTRH